MEKSILKGVWGWISFSLSLVMFAACAPTQTVAIPPQYQAPPAPPSATAQAPQPKQPAPGFSQGAVLKPSPAFKERDLSVSSEPAAPPQEKKAAAQPQHMASMHLVDQAKTALAQGKPDAAIPLLEQAIQVDVYNGEAFFSLAKAWRMKKSRAKAQEFARKAEILYQDHPSKLKEVYLFEADLFRETGDTGKADLYRQKAQKIR